MTGPLEEKLNQILEQLEAITELLTLQNSDLLEAFDDEEELNGFTLTEEDFDELDSNSD